MMTGPSVASVVGMEPRLSLRTQTPDLMASLVDLHAQVVRAGLEPLLMELVKIRASQLNHCAYCLDMHTKDARALGETEQRIYWLDAWREAPFYTERERAALALTESITLLTDGFVPDEVYQAAAEQFDERELALVIWAAALINTFNRLNVAVRTVAGSYRSAKRPLSADLGGQ